MPEASQLGGRWGGRDLGTPRPPETRPQGAAPWRRAGLRPPLSKKGFGQRLRQQHDRMAGPQPRRPACGILQESLVSEDVVRDGGEAEAGPRPCPGWAAAAEPGEVPAGGGKTGQLCFFFSFLHLFIFFLFYFFLMKHPREREEGRRTSTPPSPPHLCPLASTRVPARDPASPTPGVAESTPFPLWPPETSTLPPCRAVFRDRSLSLSLYPRLTPLDCPLARPDPPTHAHRALAGKSLQVP